MGTKVGVQVGRFTQVILMHWQRLCRELKNLDPAHLREVCMQSTAQPGAGPSQDQGLPQFPRESFYLLKMRAAEGKAMVKHR